MIHKHFSFLVDYIGKMKDTPKISLNMKHFNILNIYSGYMYLFRLIVKLKNI